MKKEDFSELMQFAMQEYAGQLQLKNMRQSEDDCKVQIGDLSVDISIKNVDNGRLFAREYVVYEDEKIVLHFILGLAAMLFSHRARHFREDLLSRYSVAGIVTLKQRFFYMKTLPASIIVLSSDKDTIWLSSAEKMDDFWDLLNGNHENIDTVFCAEELDPENFSPEFYNGTDKEIDEALNGYETKSLEDVAEVINGKSAKPYQLGDEGIPYLRARCIQDGKIIKDDAFVMKEYIVDFSKQLLQAGDILLTKFFGQYKLAQVTEEDLPAVASNAMFIIRPFGVSEGYLFKYLISNTGNKVFRQQLERVQHGVTVASVSLKDLKKLKVPVYDAQLMLDIENLEHLSSAEKMDVARKVIRNQHMQNALELEKEVYNQLLEAGWSSHPLVRDAKITLDDGTLFFADFTFDLNGTLVIFEAKTDFSKISATWAMNIRQLLSSRNRAVFVLTTGVYYEAHMPGILGALKLMHAPSPDEISKWEKEVLKNE